MSENRADFAVLGETPMARLLAGLLAGKHGRRTVLVGDSSAHFRLPKGFDLSIAPLTRPESWAALTLAQRETMKLIARMKAQDCVTQVDPIIVAGSASARQGLAHMHEMAAAFGHPVEHALPHIVGAGNHGMVLRHAMVLHRPALERRLDAWLDRSQVRRVPSDSRIDIAPDGSATLASEDGTIAIGQTILADDAALIRHLPARQWPNSLQQRVASTIVLPPDWPMAGPVVMRLDDGVSLLRQPNGTIAVFGPGTIEQLSNRISRLTGHADAVNRIGQAEYGMIATADNAPAVGRLHGTGPDVIAGFGPTGLFFAPALARWISGVPGAAEAEWFTRRLVNRSLRSSPVAEFGGVA